MQRLTEGLAFLNHRFTRVTEEVEEKMQALKQELKKTTESDLYDLGLAIGDVKSEVSQIQLSPFKRKKKSKAKPSAISPTREPEQEDTTYVEEPRSPIEREKWSAESPREMMTSPAFIDNSASAGEAN